jgi:hypothetical protein
MKNYLARIPVMFATGLLALPLSMMSAPSDQAAPKTFTGEVTDTICASTGSHAPMMAKMQSMGKDKETCTKQCAQMGAKYVLYDAANKAIYSLDDQSKAQTFAGRRVRVAGTLEGNRIRVTDSEQVG